MTIQEANKEIERIDNEIELQLNKKELEITKMQPQATKYDKIPVEGGKRVDKYANYVIKVEEIDQELDKLYKEKKIYEEYIEKELIRLNKYKEVEQLIIYYKEQCFEDYTWLQISQRVHYSESQCRKIYRKWKKQRDIDSTNFIANQFGVWTAENLINNFVDETGTKLINSPKLDIDKIKDYRKEK